eukprot:TRINITY_DN819_c0_g2_i1.p3 TRINITY_DN819_c0_g2~~TRINITY_DN819_c0_g2_i1.p3  ORF type:complete len:133 (-),score=4.21 TRINITY_DN819_c0_g2_i1:785-1153(-)
MSYPYPVDPYRPRYPTTIYPPTGNSSIPYSSTTVTYIYPEPTPSYSNPNLGFAPPTSSTPWRPVSDYVAPPAEITGQYSMPMPASTLPPMAAYLPGPFASSLPPPSYPVPYPSNPYPPSPYY